MNRILNRIFPPARLSGLSSREARQRKTLYMMLIACIICPLAVILFSIILDVAHVYYTGRSYIYLGSYIFLGVCTIILLIERFISSRIANWLFILLISAGVLLGDSPRAFLEGQSIFFLVLPVILTGLLLRPWAGYVMAAIMTIGEVVGFFIYHTGIPNIAALFMFFILAWVIDFTTSSLERALDTEQKKSQALIESEKAIAAQNQHIQEISQKLLEVQELERHLLATELHDDLGQSLTSLKLTLELISRIPSHRQRDEKINEAGEMVAELMKRVRNLSLDLRPPMLDDFGLFAALRWWFDRFQTRTGITIHCDFDLDDKDRFNRPVETAAFRIIQEALTNVARHASVTEAEVKISTGSTLSIEISDRGAGFNVHQVISSKPDSIGLSGMQERVRLLGGRMEVESNPGAGTRVLAWIPCS